MNIYLGGSCSSEQRTLMQHVANILRHEGYEVYCPFELKIPNAWDMSQEAWAQKVFDEDIHHLRECDMFLMITPGRSSTAGTNFEQGFAYALGKKIITIQFTDAETSLMTYCSSDAFVNSNIHTILTDVRDAVDKETKRGRCETILT